jgi:hypothetical protein
MRYIPGRLQGNRREFVRYDGRKTALEQGRS